MARDTSAGAEPGIFAAGLLAWRLALRELRGGVSGLWVLLACLALGVGSTSAVAGLSQAILSGIAAEAVSLLGADLEVSLSHRPASPEQIAYLAGAGVLSQSIEARVMAVAGEEDDSGATSPVPAPDQLGAPPGRALASLAAVDAAYPVRGRITLDPPMPLAEALAYRDGEWGAAADPLLASRLGIGLGGRLKVGGLDFRVRALVTSESAAPFGVFSLGPRLFLAAPAMAEAGLTGPGALARYVYKLALPDRDAVERVTKDLARLFPGAGWQVRDAEKAAPGLTGLFERLSRYLGLAGLAALLTGGLGAALAVSAHLRGRIASMAALKCLGAPARLVFTVYFLQVGLLVLAGTALGLILGAAAPFALAPLLSAYLPAPPRPGLFPGVLALSGALGLTAGLAFCLWPLGRAGKTPALILFRDGFDPPRGRPSGRVIAATAVLAGILALLCLAAAGERGIGLGFLGVVAAAALVFALIAKAVTVLAKRLPPPASPAWRHALTALHRPGNATAQVVFALGLGLTALACVALIDANFQDRLGREIPEQAPSYYFMDIAKGRFEEFSRLVTSIPGIERIENAPTLRGRIVKVGDIPAEQVKIDPDAAWALRSDRWLTFAGAMPPGTVLSGGRWWEAGYAGPPLVSMDEGIARGLGIGVGAKLTLNILGREIEAEVASLRQVKWMTLGINYVLILSPGVLEAAPYTYLAAVYAAYGPGRRDAEEALFAAVSRAMPGVTAIHVSDPLDKALAVGAAVSKAARAAALLSLLAGTLTLAQAFRAQLRDKIYESVIFKVCGATRADILRLMLPEYVLLGLGAGLGAVLLGSGVAMVFTEKVLEGGFVFFPLTTLAAVASGAALTTAFGLTGIWRALSRSAWTTLRNE